MKVLDFINSVIPLINLFGTVGVALWVWLRSPSEANTTRLDDQEDAIENLRRGIGDRLVTIEQRLPYVTTITDLGKLQATVSEISANQSSLHREVHGLRESNRRIEEFLLNSSKR